MPVSSFRLQQPPLPVILFPKFLACCRHHYYRPDRFLEFISRPPPHTYTSVLFVLRRRRRNSVPSIPLPLLVRFIPVRSSRCSDASKRTHVDGRAIRISRKTPETYLLSDLQKQFCLNSSMALINPQRPLPRPSGYDFFHAYTPLRPKFVTFDILCFYNFS